MQITELRIRNFRSIKSLDLPLGSTTVFIGPNNAGKSAILEALRIVLTRRWGQKGTGFTEHDVHLPEETGDPRTLPQVCIELVIEEADDAPWDADMVAALEDIVVLKGAKNLVHLRVTCAWSEEKEAFEPAWQFLDAAGNAMTGKATRSTNLTGFFGYLPLFWLGALRDANTEFSSRSGYWGRLLRSVRIPAELEAEVLRILGELDARIVAADPRLREISELIGTATHIAIGEGPGAARVNTLPMAIEEMLQRAGILLRNEHHRPWLPLGHHGQGLQSLAVIFLFQAAVLQQLAEAERVGTEAVFAIEEPEAHLHPQAARTLWQRIQELSGQRVVTTHSPYFVQHVPLHDVRLVRLGAGGTEVSAIPRKLASKLPWNDAVEALAKRTRDNFIFRDEETGRVAATSWFDGEVLARLVQCYRRDPEVATRREDAIVFRRDCRTLPSREDETNLAFHGRRVRGEMFFARRWILVEGVCECLLLHAIGEAVGWSLDAHGIAVIDVQDSGGVGAYATLADAFGIPWDLLIDGDHEGGKIDNQVLKRGFNSADLESHRKAHAKPNDLEDQLVADGHEALLRDIVAALSGPSAKTCPLAEFKARLKNKKTGYMGVLAPRVAADPALAMRMPSISVQTIMTLRDGRA